VLLTLPMDATASPRGAGHRLLRRMLLWVVIGTAIGFTVLLVIAAAIVPLTSNALREQLIAALADRLNGDVALARQPGRRR